MYAIIICQASHIRDKIYHYCNFDIFYYLVAQIVNNFYYIFRPKDEASLTTGVRKTGILNIAYCDFIV